MISVLKELNCGLNTINEEIHKLGISLTLTLNSKISKEDFEFLRKLFIELKNEDNLRFQIIAKRKEIESLCLRDNQDPNRMGDIEKRQLFYLLQNKPIESLLMPKIETYSEENFWTLFNWNVEWDQMTFFEKRTAINAFIRKCTSFDTMNDSQKKGIIDFINSVEYSSFCKPNSNDFNILIEWYKEWIELSEEDKEYEENIAIGEKCGITEEHKNETTYINNDSVDEESAIMSALIHGEGDRFGFD